MTHLAPPHQVRRVAFQSVLLEESAFAVTIRLLADCGKPACSLMESGMPVLLRFLSHSYHNAATASQGEMAYLVLKFG